MFSHCNYLNMSVCPPLTEWNEGAVSVVLVNPLAWTRKEYVRLPVPLKNVQGFHTTIVCTENLFQC